MEDLARNLGYRQKFLYTSDVIWMKDALKKVFEAEVAANQ